MIIFNAFHAVPRYIGRRIDYVEITFYFSYTHTETWGYGYLVAEFERLFEKLINQTIEQRHAYLRTL